MLENEREKKKKRETDQRCQGFTAGAVLEQGLLASHRPPGPAAGLLPLRQRLWAGGGVRRHRERGLPSAHPWRK